MAQNNSYTFDALTQLKDSYAVPVANTGAATVASVARVVEVGQAYVEGVVILDVTAIVVGTADDIYTISVQGSSVVAMTSPVLLAALPLGHTTVVPGGGATATIGRYYLRFQNEQNGVVYPFIRLYTTSVGTAGSITYSAFVGKTGVDS